MYGALQMRLFGASLQEYDFEYFLKVGQPADMK
jgi:hypothetical protein